MAKRKALLELDDYEQLTRTIPYLLAGLEGNTDGNQLKSVTVQQAGISGYRIVVRGIRHNGDGNPVHVVGFSNSSEPGTALLLAEQAYRENLIRWSVDRFAESSRDDNASKDERTKLSIRD